MSEHGLMPMHGDARSFADAFSAALTARGASATWLKARLADEGHMISLSTLSSWRSGSRQPDARARADLLETIERLLDLSLGTLTTLAVRPKLIPSFPGNVEWPIDDAQRYPLARDWIRNTMEGPPDENFRIVSWQEITDIGEDGYQLASTATMVVECLIGEMPRIVFTEWVPGGLSAPIFFEMIGGGRIVDLFADAENEFSGVAIEFDAPLAAGDSVLYSVRRRFSGPQPRISAIGAERPARKLVNWVRFHPAAVPSWIDEIEIHAGETRRQRRQLDTSLSVHVARWNYGPGSVTLEWGYDDAR